MWGVGVEGDSAVISHDKQDPFEVNTKAEFSFGPTVQSVRTKNTIKTEPSPVHLLDTRTDLINHREPKILNINILQNRYELI